MRVSDIMGENEYQVEALDQLFLPSKANVNSTPSSYESKTRRPNPETSEPSKILFITNIVIQICMKF